LYFTPVAKSEPAGARFIQVSAIRSLTDVGWAPVVSRNVTENAKVVAVVPEPGLTAPFWIVTVPQVRASAGSIRNPRADAASQPASPSATASHNLDRPPGATARRPNIWAMRRG
jgi:hypothetical protein